MFKSTTVRAALIQHIVEASTISIFVSIVVALVLFYVQSEVIPYATAVIWFTAFIAAALFRAIMSFHFRRFCATAEREINSRLLNLRIGILSTATIWGAASYLFFPTGYPDHQLFLIFMMAGLTSGAVVTYAADTISAHGFSIIVLTPLSIRIFQEGSDLALAMTIGVIMYLLYIIMIGRHVSRTLIENIELRILASEHEEEARKSEEYYRLIINHAPVGIFHYDNFMKITHCNERFAEILNTLPDRIFGLDMNTLRDQSVLPALQKALDGELGSYEGLYKPTLSESNIWISMTCAPSSNRSGRIIGGVAIIQDISIIHKSLYRVTALLDSMAEGAYGIDLNDRCTFVNRAFLDMLGYDTAEEVIGQPIHELIHYAHADGSHYPTSECHIYFGNHFHSQVHITDEVFWRKDGSSFAVEYWAQPVYEGDVLAGAIITFIDITERLKVMSDLQESEERFRQMFESHSAMMLLTDPLSGLIIDANPAAADFYGYPLNTLRGKSMGSINARNESQKEYDAYLSYEPLPNHSAFEHRLASGEIRNVEIYSSSIYFGDKELCFSIIHDITERKLIEEQIHNLAFYDALTHLPNRRLLYNRLEQSLIISKRHHCYGALMFLDLDNFKPLNDAHGHGAGDLLLIEVARRITMNIRDTDTAARFGGDEFVIMLTELESSSEQANLQVQRVAEKIRMALSRPYLLTLSVDDSNTLVSVEHHCSCSIGVVLYKHQDLREDILRRADMVMYEAKQRGRNCVVVEPLNSE